MTFVGIAILIVVFVASSNIEKSIKSIEAQNEEVIELLTHIKNKE